MVVRASGSQEKLIVVITLHDVTLHNIRKDRKSKRNYTKCFYYVSE